MKTVNGGNLIFGFTAEEYVSPDGDAIDFGAPAGSQISVPSMLGVPESTGFVAPTGQISITAMLGIPAGTVFVTPSVLVSIPTMLGEPAPVAFVTPVGKIRSPSLLAAPVLWAGIAPRCYLSAPGPLSSPDATVWTDWSDLATVGRQTSIYVLEIEATGFDTVRIPTSSYQSRLRSGDPSYLQVSIPDAPAWAAAVAERAEGQMILYGGIRIEETGAELLEEIARVDIGLIADQRGVRNQTLSVSGHATLSTRAARTRTLRGLSYRASSGTGKRYRCSPDVFLRPGDTAVVSEYEESITVGLIVLVVGGNQSTMEVSEAAA
ncbi:MAG: hypothetical protein RBS34_13890 [Desulfofustis sp.]|jgi:hypothetical protein|nr:hypothetical protein [Desulfofustis sp.]